ncbi:MAG: Leucine-rich repeat protein [Candidatus Roizmanbacteria bacterium GW2011_GWA2_32_13]|uniref:Leucine-rich repeat protein n=1 Tax=Candidatus Roizmanbacteria bacterium GW2011_GWA2_32_13 TaxID=1618475 RepID=A0A0F9YLW4_9BACT|nr:MAG: Leucine-rich repeat protein [Candidatus Roizmanbacteria bacterium GW2011_GWA2_32_13]
MNKFIPMNVNPVPDSVLRVFLDYKALSDKPSVEPQPQQFNKFIRNGFTMIEWGGLQ